MTKETRSARSSTKRHGEGTWGVLFLRASLLVALAVLPSRRLAAQVSPPPDSAATADSARIDSLRNDATDRLIAAEAREGMGVAVIPDLGSAGPRAAGSRLVLDRRSISWHTAQSVADLLTDIPGVYVWRAGWHGRPQYANYRGRGATSIDWVIDGVPYLPMGLDSVGVDPGLFPLLLFERMEVERWPGGLKVHLYSAQHRYLAPRSRIGITTGDDDISRFHGDLEYRWANGLGLTGVADYFDAPDPNRQGALTTIGSGLFRAQWIPRPDRGFQLQLMTLSPDQRRFLDGVDTIGLGLEGSRTDLQLRAFVRNGDEGRNFQADLLYTKSRWESDTVTQEVGAGGMMLSLRRPRWRVAGTGWIRDRWTPTTIRLEGGAVPIDWLSLDAELVRETHDGDRTSRWSGLRAGLQLPLGLEAEAGVRSGYRVVAPTLATDEAQDIGEYGLRGRLRTRYLTLEGGISSTESFSPYPFRPYHQIDSLRPLGRTDWVDLGARLTPLPWMSLDAVYSNPRGAAPDGLPPTHTVVKGEIRSRFLRTFPSGIFELRLAGEVETFGTGVIGTTSAGVPIPLKGATFVKMGVGLKLAGFQFFWERINTQGTKLTYVPDHPVPTLGQTFGMRWEFRN
jgi:hypothetical protein